LAGIMMIPNKEDVDIPYLRSKLARSILLGESLEVQEKIRLQIEYIEDALIIYRQISGQWVTTYPDEETIKKEIK